MFASLPDGWKPATQLVLDHALQQARQVLGDPGTVKSVTDYYRRESNYAGATFSQLNPNDPFRIGGSDLLAVHMLSVKIPQVSVRRLTESGPTSADLERLLASDVLSVDRNLQTAGTDTLQAMGKFYEGVKLALRPVGAKTSSPKVTASKLCARKRPDLFPIRDKRVMKLLGTWSLDSYSVDWQVFCHLLEDAPLMASLRDIVDDAAARDGVSVGDPNSMLRHLDVALWSSTLEDLRGSDQV